jgi:hypothetical protein
VVLRAAVPNQRGVCAVCFREFLLDERGRLFRHVRWLGTQTRCDGHRFPHAGKSLRGTEWALDRAARQLLTLNGYHKRLTNQPLLDCIGPFDPQYEVLWHNEINRVELLRTTLTTEIDELTARLEEWHEAAPFLEPTPIHRVALWKCRAGTAVPLCFSSAPHRPGGSPTLLPGMNGVDCPQCLRFSG